MLICRLKRYLWYCDVNISKGYQQSLYSFRNSFSNKVLIRTEENWFENMNGPAVDLWNSVTSVLCVSVNNPQNGKTFHKIQMSVSQKEKRLFVSPTSPYGFIGMAQNWREELWILWFLWSYLLKFIGMVWNWQEELWILWFLCSYVLKSIQKFNKMLSLVHSNTNDNTFSFLADIHVLLKSWISLLDENQRMCAIIFPCAIKFIQEQTQPAVIRPISSFIGLAVANNGKWTI